MKALVCITLSGTLSLLAVADEGNPKIDYGSFLHLAASLNETRLANRVSEAEFLRLSKEPGVVVLDTRSRAKFDKIHVKGALHLNFSDFSEESLRRLIPDKNTRILIYCNNNFAGDPVNFATKSAPVALNIPTFINLHAYGYRNVSELKPFLKLKTTKIPLAGSRVRK